MAHGHIINRYLFKEVLSTFIGVVVVLMLMFVSGQLVKLYGKAATGALETGSIFTSLGLYSISNLVIILPMSFFIATLLTFSRLYKDNEMVVLAATGMSQWRILRSVTGLALIFAVLVSWLSLYASPWALTKAQILTEQSKQRGDIETLSSGRFKELSSKEGVIYVQEYDAESVRMKNIFVQQSEENNFRAQDSIIRAKSGYRLTDAETGDRFLVLENGFRFDTSFPVRNTQGELVGSKKTAIIKFRQHGVRIDSVQTGQPLRLRQKAMTTTELWERSEPSDVSELQWRFSTGLLCLVLTVLAVPLSKTSPRQGRYTKLALALLLFIIYFNLLNVSRAWLNRGDISPYIGLWWVHLSMLLFALSLYVQWKLVLKRLTIRFNKKAVSS